MSDIENHELRISIQAGEGYQPTPRVEAAIHELMAAVDEADGLDVAGYVLSSLQTGFNLFYVSPSSGYTENDSKGKRIKIDYGWKIEEGVK